MCLVRYFFRYLFKLLCSFSAYLMFLVWYFFRYFFNLLSSFSAYLFRCALFDIFSATFSSYCVHFPHIWCAWFDISSATFSTYCLHFPHICLDVPCSIFFPLPFQVIVFIFRIFDVLCSIFLPLLFQLIVFIFRIFHKMCLLRNFFRYFFNLLSPFSAYLISYALFDIFSATFSTECVHFPHIW